MKESWSDLAKQLIWEMNPQANYHGTPYTFNKFDDSKFLTGEGFNAHGPGHYSADQFNIADRYRLDGISNKYDLPDGFTKLDNETKNFMLKNRISDYKKLLKESGYSDITKQKWREYIKTLEDVLNNPQLAEGNTYKVNVPNENFMWKEGVGLWGQTPYVRDAWYRNNFDYAKLLNYFSVDHDTEDIKLPQDKKFWRAYNKSYELYGELKPSLKRIFNEQMASLDVPDQLKFLVRSGNTDKIQEAMGGIKGIRAIGQQDGPINVTFSDKNIRMANTPFQRFANRIPTQTLGKMASKLYNTPGVKQTIKFADRVATPLMILEGMGLNQPVGQGSDIVLPQYPENNTIYGYINNY